MTNFLHSVRWRLSLVQSAVICLCMTVTVLTAVVLLQRALTDRAKSDLAQTLHGASGYLQHEQVRLRAAAELIAADPRVGASLSDRGSLINVLFPYYTDLNANTVDVVDHTGSVVVSMENYSVYGVSESGMTDVRQALNGNEWVGL